VEEAGVERVEDLVEVVVVADGRGEALAAAGLADVFGLAGDGLGGDVAAVAVGVGGGDGLFVELREEDVGDGVMDGVGGVFKQVGEADVQTAFAQANGGVEGGEAAKADVERWDGCAGAEVAVLLLEDGDERCGCSGFCGAFFSGRRTWRRCGWCGGLIEERGGWR
jgi:hypothetical protein